MQSRDVTKYLSIDPATLRTLWKKGVIKQASHGHYDDKSVEAYRAYLDSTCGVGEVMTILDVNKSTIKGLVVNGKIKSPSRGVYDRASVEEYLVELKERRRMK